MYSSNKLVGPHKKDVIPKFSEYKAAFQPWNQVAKSMAAALPTREDTPRDKKLPRSKSAEGKDLLKLILSLVCHMLMWYPVKVCIKIGPETAN